MQLHVPVNLLLYVDTHRNELSRQTFILKLIEKTMKEQPNTTEITEDNNDQEQQQNQ